MKKIISTGKAPAAAGPYSQAVVVDDWIWVSMQLPLDPESNLLAEGSAAEAARRIFKNIAAILEEAGASLGDIVKTTVYLSDIGNFAEVNGVYGEIFKENPPARGALEVSALPLGAPLAIEAVAFKR